MKKFVIAFYFAYFLRYASHIYATIFLPFCFDIALHDFYLKVNITLQRKSATQYSAIAFRRAEIRLAQARYASFSSGDFV